VRSWWGWGWEDEALTDADASKLVGALASRPGFEQLELRPASDLAAIDLPPPRLPLGPTMTDDRRERAAHTYGKSFRDIVRGFRGEMPNPPDLVARPKSEAEVVAVLDWCAERGAACIPYGGGSSVAGGVEADVGDDYAGVVSLDLTNLDRVLEVDLTSRAARIQGGALGPVLEEQLRPHGLTLRHFPQSFEFSTLGGWLATRSGGHYATVYTHIDDMVESMRAVTPSGMWESRRLPGSGAGPSPDRLLLGSEGILGVITEAWMRVQARPTHRSSASVHFPTFAAGAEAVRDISQSALFPTNCRLLDPVEALTSAGVSDGSALLVLGFESSDHPVEAWMDRATEICAGHGGRIPDGVRSRSGDGAAGAWRSSFLRAPYGRDALVRAGAVVETFETACTWDRFPELHAAVSESFADALGGGWVTCRFTHVYPDGPAPYFTVVAPAGHGNQLAVWNDLKAMAGEILDAHGATITHHHSVGRDHRPGYDRQRPELFARALRAAKSELDPAGILNPGVLLDPQASR
jgi:alkyldihydroxyacetonephosphate synthase